MSQWTKAESKPDPGKFLILTIEWENGERLTISECRWNEDENCFEQLVDGLDDYWIPVDSNVTHWMYYPEPAKD